MDANWVLLSMFYSTVGLGMFMYGKKAVRMIPLIAGIALMIVPYFLGSLLWMTLVSGLLMASPFLLSGLDL
ncbi:MAG: amino acid transport protein [Tepidisphaeraceae bacterium]